MSDIYTAEPIGKKSKKEATGLYINLALIIFMLAMVLFFCGILLLYYRNPIGLIILFPLFIALSMAVFLILNIKNYRGMPEITVKKDKENLYFYCKKQWVTLPLKDIAAVKTHVIGAGRSFNTDFNSGTLEIVTNDGQKYNIYFLSEVAEVKARIGIYEKLDIGRV